MGTQSATSVISSPNGENLTANLKTVRFGKCQYTCTLSNRFRRHTPEERDRMTESIRERGVMQPVEVYYDTTLDLDHCILDGEGRLEIASEVHTTVEFHDNGSLTTDEAYTLAKVYNDDRRQDDPESIRKRRQERIERVTAKRAEGESLRAIAEAEGIALGQVQRDLEQAKSTVPGGTVETPEKVKGRDGKERPAKQPRKPKAEPAVEPSMNGQQEDIPFDGEPAIKNTNQSKKSKAITAAFGQIARYADELVSGKPKLGPTRDTVLEHLQAAKKLIASLEKAVG